VKILITDDHRIVRDGLQASLEAAGFTVVGAAANGHEAIALAHRVRPDLVTMDIAMPELNGIEATRRIVSELPATRVLGLSMRSDQQSVAAMFAAGAAGYLPKASASSAELCEAVRLIVAGQKYVNATVAGLLIDHLAYVAKAGSAPLGFRTDSGGGKPLSAREREVLQLIAEGKSSKEIATCLMLSVPTVETHRRQVMNKLSLRSVAQLTKFAIREGLTPLE
jgi:DNA-binding NarL/FixJ family response regulator